MFFIHKQVHKTENYFGLTGMSDVGPSIQQLYAIISW